MSSAEYFLSAAAKAQLAALVAHSPMFAGDTLSHAAMEELRRCHCAKRNQNGDWIPTRYGKSVAARIAAKGAQ